MKQTIILHTLAHVQRAKQIIDDLALGGEWEVVIREHKNDISANQRALYWQWLTVIGHHLGETKETLHERYKDRFLTVIYERDEEEYAEMISSLREIYRMGAKTEALALRRRIVALTSITSATVKQMSEYMSDIEQDAVSLAVRLPHPDGPF